MNLAEDSKDRLRNDDSQPSSTFQERFDKTLRKQMTAAMGDNDGIVQSNFNIRENMVPSYGCTFTENNFKSEGRPYKEKHAKRMDRSEYLQNYASRIDSLL